MSENFLKADDVTMELATVLDEFSAVDCYKLKKNAPVGSPSKRALSYKTILKTNFPGASPAGIQYKLPDSIDMDYIDILSGKNAYKHSEEGAKIPISMESFEKLCYSPELTKEQKQAMIERAKREEAAQIEDEMSRLLTEELEVIHEDESSCSPCCFDIRGSAEKENEALHEVLLSSDSIQSDAEEREPLISPEAFTTEEPSDVLEVSDVHSTESNYVMSEKREVLFQEEFTLESNASSDVVPPSVTLNGEGSKSKALSKQLSKKNSSPEKRKKSVFERIFSRKGKRKESSLM